MLEQVVLLAQTVSVASIAAWLTLGVRDNILHPSVNETYTAQVMQMTRLREEYPKEYARLAHRAVTDRRVHALAFRLVVLVEITAALMLWIGVIGMCMAMAGTGSIEAGKSFSMIGALMFTTIWAAFLVIGNHFTYWFCHEGAQNTHFQMTLWGLGTMIFLAAV